MDGVPVRALEGESIAAALIADGRRQFRTDRDGRARGFSCGMGVCGECELFQDSGIPLRACMTAAQPGMRLRSSRYRREIPTDTYPPPAAEELIVCDVLIVGAGPAGMSAAELLGRTGIHVLVVDERGAPGGQYFKPLAASQDFRDGVPGDSQYGEGRALMQRMSDVGVSPLVGTTVWGLFPGADGGFEAGFLGERSRGGERRSCIRAQHVVLAAGAFESLPAFPGWTLPGVMSTGAAQGLLRSYRVSPGERVLIAGNGPLNLQLACELVEGGAEVVAVAEAAPARRPAAVAAGLGMLVSDARLAAKGIALLARLRRAGVPVLWGQHIARAEGATALASATLAPIDASGSLIRDQELRFDVDTLCLGYALSPSNELARQLGCQHRSTAPGLLEPLVDGNGETTVPGVFVVGDGGRLGGAQLAQAEGRLAARAIIERFAGPAIPGLERDRRWRDRQRRFQRHLWSLFAAPAYVPDDPDTLVCRCECVPLKTVLRQLEAGVTDFASLKRGTRVGMGSCQGRYCQRQLATVVAAVTGIAPDAQALFEARQPAKPVPIGELASEQPEWGGYRSVEAPSGGEGQCHSRAVVLEAEVLVVGAGIIGLCTALHLARAGRDVVLVDRSPPLTQASGSNAGSLHGQLLSWDFSDPSAAASSPAAQTLRLQQLGIREWQALEFELAADFEMSLGGGLVVAENEVELAYLRRKAEIEASFGLRMEMLDGLQLRERLPLAGATLCGGLLCHDEGKINPLAAGPAVVAAVRDAGARFEVPCRVVNIERAGQGFRVHTTGPTLSCRRLVNAAGGWSARIAAMLGAELPVRTAPQQMIVTEALEPVVPLLLAAAGRHLTLKQLSNGNVIIGGGWPGAFDYERDRALVRRDSVAGNLWVASRVIPALAGVRLLRSWSTVGVMTDGAPIVGEYPGIPGFFNAVGANGYTMGPILGRISAGMILGEEAPLDLAPFLVDRFG
jgi:glycine/D-amino acid oxidase-like deaminating enzyme